MNRLACHVPGLGTTQKPHHLGHFLGFPPSPQQSFVSTVVLWRARTRRFPSIGIDQAGHQTVDGDPVNTEVMRQTTRETNQARLGRQDVRTVLGARVSGHATHVDNASCT